MTDSNTQTPTQPQKQASVYDDMDKLTLEPEDMALMGALTQTQVDVAEASAENLAEIKALIEEEAAADAVAAPTITPTNPA